MRKRDPVTWASVAVVIVLVAIVLRERSRSADGGAPGGFVSSADPPVASPRNEPSSPVPVETVRAPIAGVRLLPCQVRWSDGGPVPGATVEVVDRRASGSRWPATDFGLTKDGFIALPVEALARAMAREGAVLRARADHACSDGADSVGVEAALREGVLVLELRADTVVQSFRVTMAGNGAPVPSVAIHVTRASLPAEWTGLEGVRVSGHGRACVFSSISDHTGVATFRGLVPGEHSIAVSLPPGLAVASGLARNRVPLTGEEVHLQCDGLWICGFTVADAEVVTWNCAPKRMSTQNGGLGHIVLARQELARRWPGIVAVVGFPRRGSIPSATFKVLLADRGWQEVISEGQPWTDAYVPPTIAPLARSSQPWGRLRVVARHPGLVGSKVRVRAGPLDIPDMEATGSLDDVMSLPEGRYRVACLEQGLEDTQVSIDVSSGAESVVQVPMERRVPMGFTLRDDAGRVTGPVWLTVTAPSSDGGSPRTVFESAFADSSRPVWLPPGDYTWRIVSVGHRDHIASVRVGEEGGRVDLSLEPQP